MVSLNLIREIVENIKEAADELRNKGRENRINGILLKLEKILTKKYPVIFINHQQCFIKPSGDVFSVQQFPGVDAIVVEYAESEADASLHRFEDGDRFYLAEMKEQQLIQAVLREIEQ